jgi:hypothetical protein
MKSIGTAPLIRLIIAVLDRAIIGYSEATMHKTTQCRVSRPSTAIIAPILTAPRILPLRPIAIFIWTE